MKDLIKAQLYQILRSKPFYYIIFGIMAFQGLDIIGSINGDGITSISMYIVQYCGTAFTTSAIAACLVAVYIVGGDINDKTANYEILSGHTRREIFIAKAVLGVICGSIAYRCCDWRVSRAIFVADALPPQKIALQTRRGFQRCRLQKVYLFDHSADFGRQFDDCR